jgi:hypothetical protein
VTAQQIQRDPPSTPAPRSHIKSEIASFGKIAKAAGIKAE